MGRAEKLYSRLKVSPHNASFKELCKLAELVGFRFERQKGSHKLYIHELFPGRIMNFQSRRGKAKPTQIRQLLGFIDEYGLLEEAKNDE